ncbi:hypothetical protein KA005_11970 [bacterium]|nr:hypothetical protein [bacterium]
MGGKAKRLNARQAEMAVTATGEAFQALNRIYDLIYDNHPKKARLLGKYHTTWLHLQGLLDLMELEVERACLG